MVQSSENLISVATGVVDILSVTELEVVEGLSPLIVKDHTPHPIAKKVACVVVNSTYGKPSLSVTVTVSDQVQAGLLFQ